jgi:3-oxoacyl-[acyl-carrier protein] reductase
VASYAGSVAGIGGGYAHYGANKAAIAHYTRYLVGPHGINCNCIASGVIETARIVQLMGARARENEANPEIALRRNGRPEDCAKVVEFLCTDLSDYVSGALIPIDGGWNRAG